MLEKNINKAETCAVGKQIRSSLVRRHLDIFRRSRMPDDEIIKNVERENFILREGEKAFDSWYGL